MTWPQVTEIEIPRYTFCGYCPYQFLKVSYDTLKTVVTRNKYFEVGSLDLTWDDLELEFSEKTRNWCMKRHAQNGVSLIAKKVVWSKCPCHPPPTPTSVGVKGAKNVMITWCVEGTPMHVRVRLHQVSECRTTFKNFCFVCTCARRP